MRLMLRAAVRSIRWEGWHGMNRNADPAKSPSCSGLLSRQPVSGWYLRASYGLLERRQLRLYRRTARPSVVAGAVVGRRRFLYSA